MCAERRRRPRFRGFSLLELSATLVLSAVIAAVAIGTFSSLVGAVAAWRAHIGVERRASIVADWLRDELALAGGGPLPRRLAVAVDDDGALHVLTVVPPAVDVREVAEGPGCSNGLTRQDPACIRTVVETTQTATFQPAQWPFPIGEVDDDELEIPSPSNLCPSVARTPLLALVAREAIAVVQVTSSSYDSDDHECEVGIRSTSFPGAAAGSAFDGGAAIPVRWRTLLVAAGDDALRARWNGHPPERIVATAAGLSRVALPDDDIAVAQLRRFVVRFGDDVDGDGLAESWSEGATPVAQRDAIELAAVIAMPSSRAPRRTLQLPSGASFAVPDGSVAALAVARVTLSGVGR
jgi:prepilin-type N-terminal cleavage/methylation domain-containing protein